MHAVTMRANASTLVSGAVPAKIGAISGVVEASFFFFSDSHRAPAVPEIAPERTPRPPRTRGSVPDRL